MNQIVVNSIPMRSLQTQPCGTEDLIKSAVIIAPDPRTSHVQASTSFCQSVQWLFGCEGQSPCGLVRDLMLFVCKAGRAAGRNDRTCSLRVLPSVFKENRWLGYQTWELDQWQCNWPESNPLLLTFLNNTKKTDYNLLLAMSNSEEKITNCKIKHKYILEPLVVFIFNHSGHDNIKI